MILRKAGENDVANPVSRPPDSGMTLIELAIVLIVIGLLAGGIMIGKDLLVSHRLQTAIHEVEKFKIAINSFKSKYDYLPGDLPNATHYWGADSNCPTTATNTVPKKETCNGNGNGTIGNFTEADPADQSATYYEWYRAWQHLANAGLIPGQYSGVTGSVNYEDEVEGINVPMLDHNGAGVTLMYFVSFAGDIGYYPATYRHRLMVGWEDLGTGAMTKFAFTPREAYFIDSKLDDGMPGGGTILSFNTSKAATCPDDATIPSPYKTAYTYPACSLIFILGY